MEDLNSLIMKIKRARGEELTPLLREISNASFKTKDELMEILRILVQCLRESDELVRNTAIEVLEHIVLGGVLEKFLIGEQVPYLLSESYNMGEYTDASAVAPYIVNSEFEQLEVHDFADFVVDFHHEDEGKKNSQEFQEKEIKKDENYLRFMQKREKYIDLWDFEIPEE
ncbi:MAG: hypothetical protein ABIL91_03180 [candidate division WOR-3 bacterium]